jgi:hypothetical protein
VSVLASNIAIAAYLGKLAEVRRALAYDLTDLPFPQEFDGAAGRLWRALMRGWKSVQP